MHIGSWIYILFTQYGLWIKKTARAWRFIEMSNKTQLLVADIRSDIILTVITVELWSLWKTWEIRSKAASYVKTKT